MKRLSFVSVIVMFVAMLFVSCGSSEDYTTSLPEKSVVGIKISVSDLLADSEIMEDPQVQGMLKGAISELPENSKDLMMEIVEAPSATGLDFAKPVYLMLESVDAQMNDAKGMVLFAVGDRGKLTSFLETVIDKDFVMENRDGCDVLVYEGSCVGAYDDTRLVLAYAESGDALEYVTPRKDVSRTEAMKQFISSSDDVTMYCDFSALSHSVMKAKELIKSDIYDGVASVSSLNFDSGKLQVDYEMYGADELKKLAKKYIRDAKGTYLKLVTEDAYGVIQFGMYNILSVMELYQDTYSQMVEQVSKEYGFDMNLLNTIDGDVLLAVLPIPASSITGFPEFVMAAKCKDASLYEYVVSQVSKLDAGMTKVDETVYKLSPMLAALGFDYCIGYADETLFVVPGRMLDNVKGGSLKSLDKNFADTKLASKLGNAGMVCNFQSLSNGLSSSVWGKEQGVQIAADVMKEFQDCAIYSEEIGEGHFVLDFTDKETNSLKKLIDIVKKQAMSVMMRM